MTGGGGFLLLTLLSLSAYRLWRLIGKDDVTEWFRDKLGDGWALSLVHCSWCLGSWIAFAVVGAYHFGFGFPLPALWYGAVAALVGLLGEVA